MFTLFRKRLFARKKKYETLFLYIIFEEDQNKQNGYHTLRSHNILLELRITENPKRKFRVTKENTKANLEKYVLSSSILIPV